jgi:peroxiredoxin
VLPEGAKWPQRVTFVVDPTGVVRHVDRKVSVGTHGADLLPILDGLLAADAR